jgi:hypothetical protein
MLKALPSWWIQVSLLVLTTASLQVRRVIDVIRGRSYEEALVLMEYMPYRYIMQPSCVSWKDGIVMAMSDTLPCSSTAGLVKRSSSA